MVLAETKLHEAAAWDGFHGVYTNIRATQLAGTAVLQRNRGLWQVEAAFRVAKHDLQVRPIYHWKPSHIEAHVAIAFMSLTLVRILSHRVEVQQHEPMSEENTRNALQQAQVLQVHDAQGLGRFAIPVALKADAKGIYKTMDLPYRNEPFNMN